MDEEAAANLAIARANALTRLAEATAEMGHSMEALRQDVARIHTLRRIDQVKLWLLTVAIVLASAGLVGTFYGQAQNHKVLSKINCATDVTGRCSIARAGQQSQVRALQQLEISEQSAIVWAITCIRQLSPSGQVVPIPKYEACINAGVKSDLRAAGFPSG